MIFPSAIRAADYFKEPLAEYYLYTSPHGGADIRLYLANSITGPWKLQGTVVDKRFGSADHVSSPHAVWNEQAKELFLYVHAPNDQTISCHSTDGVHFEHGGVCVTSKMLSDVVGFQSKSASYARVYTHRIPEYGNSWTMTLTASGKADKQGIQKNAIVLCTSDDGIKWTVRRTLIDDGNAGRTYKSLDACWLPLDGRNLLVYARRSRAEQGKKRTEPVRLHISEGDANWRNWSYQGVFYNPLEGYPDDGAARGVSYIEANKKKYLLYEAGQKNAARIGLLTLTTSPAPEVPQRTRLDEPQRSVSLDAILKNVKLEMVYETSFEKPLRVIRESELIKDGKFVREPPKDVNWVLEGPGKVRLESGRLHLRNPEGHSVLWNTREFPENFVAEWDIKHHHQQRRARADLSNRTNRCGLRVSPKIQSFDGNAIKPMDSECVAVSVRERLDYSLFSRLSGVLDLAVHTGTFVVGCVQSTTIGSVVTPLEHVPRMQNLEQVIVTLSDSSHRGA